MSLKIIYMGTPDFAVNPLKAIVEESAHTVIAVYSQPPRPSGRGHKLTKSPVQTYAEAQGIPVYTPLNFKKSTDEGMAAREEFAELNADVAVVAAYGLILPQAVLDAPKHGCLNIHGSILPRWRGAAPIQRAIWEGDASSGITIMRMERGLDTGPMILKGETPITETTTAQDLHDALSNIGADLIVKTLDTLDKNGELQMETQDDALSNYAHMLSKENGKINWSQTATQIDRQIRALNPWPGTYTSAHGKTLKILTAKCHPERESYALEANGSSEIPRIATLSRNDKCGTILNKHGEIACGDGSVLKLETVKPENSRAMDFASALNGGHINVGDVLC